MEGEALAEAIRGAQEGRAEAFDRIIDAYSARIYGFVSRMTGSRQDAEDLMQEVFVRLVRMIGAYRHDGRFEPWLFRIAANVARDHRRRGRRSPIQGQAELVGGNEPATAEPPGRAEPVDAALIRREEVAALNEAMNRLTEGEREVILLRHFSQMSFREIADATAVPLGTALARAHRGLARLREIMASANEVRRITGHAGNMERAAR